MYIFCLFRALSFQLQALCVFLTIDVPGYILSYSQLLVLSASASNLGMPPFSLKAFCLRAIRHR